MQLHLRLIIPINTYIPLLIVYLFANKMSNLEFNRYSISAIEVRQFILLFQVDHKIVSMH